MTDSHPSRNLYGESKVKRFYSIIWVRAKDELTKPKCNKCRTTDSIGSLGESLNLMGQLCMELILFLSSTSTGSSSMEISILPGYIAPRIGNNSWFATSSKVTVILLQERKKVWVALQHRWTKWQRLNKRYLDKQWDETMAFNTLTCCNATMKPMLDNFCPPIRSNPRRYPT